MQVLQFSWCGMQVPAFDPVLEFYTEILGMRLIKLDRPRDLAIWVLPSGQGFEIFGPQHANSHGWDWPVFSFDVESVADARAEMESKGVEFTAGILGAPGGRVWTYFKDPDDYLYEIAEPWAWRRAEGAVPPGSDPPADRIALTVSGFHRIGIRPKKDFQASVAFFGDTLGLKQHELDSDQDFAHFVLPSGESLELFGPRNPHAQVTGGPVLGFEVDDVPAARAAMEARQVQFLGETTHSNHGRSRAPFKDPSGFAHEICHGWSTP